jgi:hypothetical protein
MNRLLQQAVWWREDHLASEPDSARAAKVRQAVGILKALLAEQREARLDAAAAAVVPATGRPPRDKSDAR